MEQSGTTHKRKHKTAPFPKGILFAAGLAGLVFAGVSRLTSVIEPQGALIGQKAPEIKGVIQDGSTVRLSDFKRKAVFLDFWADW